MSCEPMACSGRSSSSTLATTSATVVTVSDKIKGGSTSPGKLHLPGNRASKFPEFAESTAASSGLRERTQAPCFN